ncbi:MAG TPA: acyl-CoA dehydrogenase family protein, partial [Burkholderiaceae bacterium]|nr:acyl-CoA dehydrogenase family protein [Burkholderiaceae bacterium]
MSTQAAFDWSDPFLLDQQLSDDERSARDVAAQYAQQRLSPRVLEAFRREQAEPAIFREMGDLGLLAATLPSAYGGSDLSAVSYGLIAHEIERVDSGYRSMMSVQSALVILPIYTFGSEAQRQRYLPALARGEHIGCFGLTEPDHGSDPAGMRTRARKVKGGFVLRGSKTWITNAPIADILVVWAKNDEGNIRAYLLERSMAGLSTPAIQGKMGLRSSVTGDIVMDDVFVPEANELPGATGLRGPFTCLASARFGIAWGALGAARDCWMRARDYVLNR